MSRFVCAGCDVVMPAEDENGKNQRHFVWMRATNAERVYVDFSHECCAICHSLAVESFKPRNWMGSALQVDTRLRASLMNDYGPNFRRKTDDETEAGHPQGPG